MAEHCRIQKTYLSKVLNRDGHLSEDQTYLATEYLGLSAEEQAFTLLLHRIERSQLPARREQLSAEIDAIRRIKLKTESNIRVDTPPSIPSDLTEYYLDPLFQVIHMMLTLRKYQQAPGEIGVSLGLKSEALHKYLRGLQRMGLAKLTEVRGQMQRAQILRDNLHLPQTSALHGAYSARMRLKAIERMGQLSPDESYSFSAIFSTNPRVRQKIHASFIEWLKTVQKSVQASREEEVYQINFDLLNWS
jgi:hypothetical protein